MRNYSFMEEDNPMWSMMAARIGSGREEEARVKRQEREMKRQVERQERAATAQNYVGLGATGASIGAGIGSSMAAAAPAAAAGAGTGAATGAAAGSMAGPIGAGIGALAGLAVAGLMHVSGAGGGAGATAMQAAPMVAEPFRASARDRYADRVASKMQRLDALSGKKQQPQSYSEKYGTYYQPAAPLSQKPFPDTVGM